LDWKIALGIFPNKFFVESKNEGIEKSNLSSLFVSPPFFPRMTFIADERFQSFYVENTGLWTLQIKYVQARGELFFWVSWKISFGVKWPLINLISDAGIYECQVSTEPKVSARVHLHVVGK
jgi:hypothetical protein